jgi:uncharacterized protein (TIGR02147 family)
MSARVLLNRPPAAEDFRQRLQRELANRCARNPRYSLRGFANFLGIDHATLSQLLRGKRAVTAAAVRRLGARIGLSAAEIEAHVALQREAASARPAERERVLGEEAAAALDWQAYAILELMRLAEFRPDVGWIERVLGIGAAEIQVALQHLVRLGFLRMSARDRWEDLTGGAILRQEEFSLVALQRLIVRSGTLQAASANRAPAEPRLHGAVTVAVTAAQLARLLGLAENLLREAGAESSRAGDQLYNLEIHCYPISTKKG